MKFLKTLAAAALLTAGTFVSAAPRPLTETGFQIGLWFDYPGETMYSHVKGVKLGLPISAGNGKVDGWELSAFSSGTREVCGLQSTILGATAGRQVEGLQLALVNVCTRLYGMQLGVVNTSIQFVRGLQLGVLFNYSAANGVQIGTVNYSANNALFQVGVVCINKHGLLPVMILFNMCSF